MSEEFDKRYTEHKAEFLKRIKHQIAHRRPLEYPPDIASGAAECPWCGTQYTEGSEHWILKEKLTGGIFDSFLRETYDLICLRCGWTGEFHVLQKKETEAT